MRRLAHCLLLLPVLAVGSLAHGRVLFVSFIDSAAGGNPLQLDARLQTLVYDADRVDRNLESRKRFGQSFCAADDKQVGTNILMGRTARGQLDLARLDGDVRQGDLLQFVAYWTVSGRVHVTFDSIVMDKATGSIRMGTNDSLVVPQPEVTRSPTGNTIRFVGLGEPHAITPGDGPSRPGALEHWNVYRVENGQYQLVAKVPNDSGFRVVVDQPPAGSSPRYGIVPVFRASTIEAGGPRSTGIELRRQQSGCWQPLLSMEP